MSKQSDINTIANRLTTAQDNIHKAEEKADKSATNVKLMAVSKTKPNDLIEQAFAAGQRIFGENYAQELHRKSQELSHLADIEWHYIGPIQSNKTKIIAESAHWVDSVDRFKIAQRFSQHAVELNKNLNLLIQVNISRSDNKSGVLLEDVAELAEQISQLPSVTLRGLLAIPDQHPDENQLIAEFSQMQACFQQLKEQYSQAENVNIDTLSLGMSGDMNVAIQCGSTMVRIGTAIFGARETKPSLEK